MEGSDQEGRRERRAGCLQLYDDHSELSATSSINHERSPVLLTTDYDRDRWLLGTPDEAAAVIGPIAGDALAIVQEGFEKRDLLGAQPTPAGLLL